MPVQRKVFRIEQMSGAPAPIAPAAVDAPHHHEILAELKALQDLIERQTEAARALQAQALNAQEFHKPDAATLEPGGMCRLTGLSAMARRKPYQLFSTYEGAGDRQLLTVGQSAMRRATAGRIWDACLAGQKVANSEAIAAAATRTAIVSQGTGKPMPVPLKLGSFSNSR